MDRRREARWDQRMACRLEIEDRRYPGVVVDVSTQGLFVRTPVTAPQGASVWVHVGGLPLPYPPALVLESVVARSSAPSKSPSGAVTGGLGLSIARVPDAWKLLAEIAPCDPVSGGVLPALRPRALDSCSQCGREGATLWHGLCGWCGGSRPTMVREMCGSASSLAPLADLDR